MIAEKIIQNKKNFSTLFKKMTHKRNIKDDPFFVIKRQSNFSGFSRMPTNKSHPKLLDYLENRTRLLVSGRSPECPD